MKRTLLSLTCLFMMIATAAFYVNERLATRQLLLAAAPAAAYPTNDDAALRAENARLRSEVEAAEVEALKNTGALADLKADVERLQKRSEIELRRARKNTAAETAKAQLLPTPPLPPSPWKQVGHATALDTFHSALAAAVDGDVDALAALIAFDPAGSAEVKALYQRLPPQTRAQYPTEAHVIATLLASRIPLNLTAATVHSQVTNAAGQTVMKLELSRAAGASRSVEFRFVPAPGGWRLVVPDHIVKSYTASLALAPGTG